MLRAEAARAQPGEARTEFRCSIRGALCRPYTPPPPHIDLLCARP